MVIRTQIDPPYPDDETNQIPCIASVHPQTIENTDTSNTTTTGRWASHATQSADDLIDLNESRQQQPRRGSDISSHGTWDSSDSEEDSTRDTEKSPSNSISRPRDQLSAKLPTILTPGFRPAMSDESEKDLDHTVSDITSGRGHQQPGKLVTGSGYTLEHEQRPAIPPPPTAAPPPPPLEPADGSRSLSLGHEFAGLSLKAETPLRMQHPYPLPEVEAETAPPSTARHNNLSANNPWRSALADKYRSTVSPTANLPKRSPFAFPSQDSQFEPAESSKQSLQDVGANSSPTPINLDNDLIASSATLAGSVEPSGNRQRSEHYQIKHVRWTEGSHEMAPSADSQPRQSPILTQNANGPCPLLALVNALILSTPQHVTTALTEALRTREQISLGFLLDAVFDELTSTRRGAETEKLPDVSELYAFLLALHTGMNVNPRFARPDNTQSGPSRKRPEVSFYDSDSQVDFFERTNELTLYGTFQIPLIHGWLEPQNSTTYRAFQRSGQTFEDAQNILCVESELESKKRRQGLSSEEQQILQDVYSIHSFFDNWPTQLTEYGLEEIWRRLAPGRFAILFRNDHFSTIYKEPAHGTLVTLVTDAGYASHDEIVWESLVDINGAANEYYSGDFRPIGHNADRPVPVSTAQVAPVSAKLKTQKLSNATPSSEPKTPPKPPYTLPDSSHNQPKVFTSNQEELNHTNEQEDHDLALALQLQEEEEDRQRQTNARLQRERELSERFLSNEEQSPQIPPRRNNNRHTQPVQTPVPHRPEVYRPSSPQDTDAPPSYQQSASDRLYRPAGATANTPGNPLQVYDALRRQQSAQAQQSTTSVNSGQARRRSDTNRIRRRSSQMGTVALRDGYPSTAEPMGEAPMYSNGPNHLQQDERCVMM